jgi:hypothetical protein
MRSLLLTQIAVNSAQAEYMRQLLTQQMIHDFSPMAFRLVVRRSSLVQDTLNSLVSTDPFNYKKPLLVSSLPALCVCMSTHHVVHHR